MKLIQIQRDRFIGIAQIAEVYKLTGDPFWHVQLVNKVMDDVVAEQFTTQFEWEVLGILPPLVQLAPPAKTDAPSQ